MSTTTTKRFLLACVLSLGLLCATKPADAAVIVTPEPTATWLGFMNVFELPANGGGFVFPSAWGTADLRANFSGNVLTLEAAPISTSDSFWYQGGTGGPGVPGNKNMEANMYVEVNDNSLSGQDVTFTGTVLSNTLVSPYTSVAFIKDFAPDYSSFNIQTVPLTPGDFSVTLNTVAAAGRHVQYGFQTVGPNVWPTDVASKGAVQVIGIPEPTALALIGVAAGAAMLRRRRATAAAAAA